MNVASWTYAQFSPSAEAAFRTAYGVLLLLQIVWTIPHARRFFTTEKYGGYIESDPFRDRVHVPATAYAAVALWVLVALAFVFNRFVLAASLANFALAFYFFVRIRWRTILRGMGAPGHMNYWISALLVMFAVGDFVPQVPLRATAVVAFRIDFALIMIFAGIYKLSSGYARGDGFERGLVNPWWGWWSSLLKGLPPRSPAFVLLDHAAYLTEIACGIAFFVPLTAPWAALLLGASFLGIGAMIRLTFLAEMVAACCLLYVWPGSPVDRLFTSVWPPGTPVAAPHGGFAAVAGWVLTILLAAYVVMLPFAYCTMTVNFYFRRRLPEPLQRFFDAWNLFFGLILWRVFTNDIINFYCEIYERLPDSGDRRLRVPLRFNHVGEFICLASLFTTLKYYPGDPDLFRSRVVRYARSLPLTGNVAVFRYFRIQKGTSAFEYPPVAEFVVDTASSTVERVTLDARYDPSATEPGSPIHTAGRPGSYAPVARP